MKLMVAKARRRRAELDNLEAVIDQQPPPFSDDELAALGLAIDIAAAQARTAGVEVDDIVGPDVRGFP